MIHAPFVEVKGGNIMGYENFVLEAMSKENYEQVRDFAVNEYFSRLDEESKRAVATAYARVGKGMGTTTDETLVMLYYSKAELEYNLANKGEMPYLPAQEDT